MPFDRQLTTGVVQLLRIHKVLPVLQKGFRSLYVFLCSTSKFNSCSGIYTNATTCLNSISTSVGPKQTLVFDSSMMTRTLSSTSTLTVHYLLVFWEQRNTLSQFACFSKINLAFLHFSHCWRKSMKGPLLPTSDSVAGDLVVASCSSFPSLPEPGLALFPSEKFFASDGLVPPLSTHRKLHTKHGWPSRVVLESLILLVVLSVLLLLLVLLRGSKLLKSLSLVPTTSSPLSTTSFSSPETMFQWNMYNIQFELNSFELCHPG